MKQARLGRRPLDLAERVRAWGWYYLLQQETGLNDYQLGLKYFNRAYPDRRRFFENLRKRGSQPNPTVLKSVHEDGACPRAWAWYDSPLWTFLTTPGLQTADFTRFIEAECGRRGWYRAISSEVGTGRIAFGEHEIGFVRGLTPSYSAMLHHICDLPGLDGMAMLSALFREAYGEFELALADCVRRTLLHCLVQCQEQVPWPADISQCFSLLVQDRVLKNNWLHVEDMPQDYGYANLKYKEQRTRLILNWYLSEQTRLGSRSVTPIILESPRTSWLRKNSLQVFAKYLEGVYSNYRKITEVPGSAGRRKAETRKETDYLLDAEDSVPQSGDYKEDFSRFTQESVAEVIKKHSAVSLVRAWKEIPRASSDARLPLENPWKEWLPKPHGDEKVVSLPPAQVDAKDKPWTFADMEAGTMAMVHKRYAPDVN